MLPEGITAKFDHYRVPSHRAESKKGKPKRYYWYKRGRGFENPALITDPHPKGGRIECYLYKDDVMISTGTAVCSMSDNFCYRIGREIALGRALKKLENGE